MISFDTLHTEVEQHQSELDQIISQFRDKMKDKFTELTTAFFNECPRVQAVVWEQYTPYFNDGEECTFSVGEVRFIEKGFDRDSLEKPYHYEDDDEYTIIESVDDWSLNYHRENLEKNPNSEYHRSRLARLEELMKTDDGTAAKCDKLESFIKSNDDLFKAVFGDHVIVYLTPGETIVEEYSDHD